MTLKKSFDLPVFQGCFSIIKSKELFNFVTGLTNFELGFFFCLFVLNPALKDFELPQIFKERGVGRQSPSKKKTLEQTQREQTAASAPCVHDLCARLPAGQLEVLTVNI